MGSPRLGLTFPMMPLDVRASCDAARRAEDLGYTDGWTAEVSGPDGIATAAALGIATTSMRLGCAIVPAYTRPPALIAMGALAAHQASAGRFVLGIGASSPVIVESWMGLGFDKPYTRVTETFAAVKAALAGDKVRYDGETVTVRSFKLDAAIPEVPVFVAALGPRMTRFAAEHADGIALYLATETGVRMARAASPGKEIVERLVCCPDVPVEDIRPMLRFQIAPYAVVPAYNRYLSAQGFEEEAVAAAAHWGAGDRASAVEAITDEMVDALTLIGPAEACKERIESFREAGLDTPILMLVSPQGPDGVLKLMERMAP